MANVRGEYSRFEERTGNPSMGISNLTHCAEINPGLPDAWEIVERLFKAFGISDLKPLKADEYSVAVLSDQIHRGDHIAINKHGSTNWHHGIYLGRTTNGERLVVDFWGPDKSSAKISKDLTRILWTVPFDLE